MGFIKSKNVFNLRINIFAIGIFWKWSYGFGIIFHDWGIRLCLINYHWCINYRINKRKMQ